MLPEPEDFPLIFYELFEHHIHQTRKHVQWKKTKKKTAKQTNDPRSKTKMELLSAYGNLGPPEVDVPGNASTFAVFASVRLAVLERWMRWACQEYHLSSSSVPAGDLSEADSDTEDLSQTTNLVLVPVPKIVNVGLRSVFELIRESRTSHPQLCTKALSALLDVLQGQTPEGLKAEPPEAIEPLFDLLLDLATLHGPESSSPNDGKHLTAVACSCLLALVVVRGDTGKFLSALAALLMCPRALSTQNIQMPTVLTALQRCIHNVLLTKIVRPDWFTFGVPTNSRINSFRVRLPLDVQAVRSMCSDGQYIYLLTTRGLFKVGSGYGGTVKGHIYMHRTDFYPNEKGWLGFCNNNLYLRRILKQCTELLAVERDGLLVTGAIALDTRESSSCVMFSDGDNLGVICVAKDDGFVVKTLNPSTNPPNVVNELSLKLARRCVDVIGAAAHEKANIGNTTLAATSEAAPSQNLPSEELLSIVAGKEFTLVRTISGHVMYSGKATALGLKQTRGQTTKWNELTLTKSPKVTHIAVGHEGMHAILVTEDGSAFFAGLARRGEDGDQNKARRQPKPSKPKKMIKVDDKFIVHAACNSATSALVTRDGELLMFGKDTQYADPSNGVVTDLKGEHIVQVALGKAHAVALNVKGHVFTFGINNKYQCGREFPHHAREAPSNNVDLNSPTEQSCHETPPLDARGAEMQLCPKYCHEWHSDQCMICKICGECTGYGNACFNAYLPDRYPGQECGCGGGQSGCAVCGCCKSCGGGYVSNSDTALREKSRYSGNNVYGYYSEAKDEQKKRQRKAVVVSSKHANKSSTNSRGGIVKTVSKQGSQTALSNTPKENDAEKDATRVSTLSPGRLYLPSESPVIQVACGLHHTVLLLQNGMVYTFGSNQYGQLGSGDIVALTGPQLVRVSATHIAAGSNHTVILTNRGEVLTFGNYVNGQLGRNAPTVDPETSVNSTTSAEDLIELRYPWHASPGPVPHVGQRYSRKATWVGASGDQTFLKIDESLVNATSLSQSTVIANRSCIVLLPNQERSERHNSVKCLVINRHDGNCNSYSGKEQVSFIDMATCMDPLYNVIWSYNLQSQEMTCYNVVACQVPVVLPMNDATKMLNTQHHHQMFVTTTSISNVEKLQEKNSNVGGKLMMENNEKNIEDKNNGKQIQNKINNLADKKTTNTSGNRNIVHFNNCTQSKQHSQTISKYSSLRQSSSNTELSPKNSFNNVLNADQFHLDAILSCELALPVVSNCQITRTQAALHLLCCLDTLTVAHDLKMTINMEVDEKDTSPAKPYTKDDYQAVNRFENYGGGWGYSGHSCEAIRFMADTDVLIGGFGLFGGRGEYTARIRLLDLGIEGGEHEGEGELLAETETQHYECPIRQKHPILFESPVPIKANRWYLAWCRVCGPSSDCGSAGQSMVNSEEQVVFYFKSSKKSNNGTDVNAGQIPQILYRIITPETQSNSRPPETQEPIHVLSKDFSRLVTKECFQSLLALLQWSWNTFKLAFAESQQISSQAYTQLELERLVYVCRASLRLIRTYINEIYPNHILKKPQMENVLLAQCIGDVRSLLKQILSDSVRKRKGKSHKLTEGQIKMINGIFDECHHTFVASFHAFYPTSYLKWSCLCDLLMEMDKDKELGSHKNERLLSAVVAALCSPTIRLRSLCPTLYRSKHLSPGYCNNDGGLSPSDNSGMPIMSPGDGHCYPILVEQMSYRTQLEGGGNEAHWSLREVVDRLLIMVTNPVRTKLLELSHHTRHLPALTKHACHLLAKLLAELAYQCTTADEELQGGCGRGPIHATPVRFARTNQSRPWNTGGGSPDSVCFKVDRPGVAIAGVAIYAGQGQYDYELELIEDTTVFSGGIVGGAGDTSAHSQRWLTLEQVKGTFGVDDCVAGGDIMELKFENLVPIKENVTYAIRLRNHGGRTNNGDGGFSSVKGPDGTSFTFSTCSLSFNGTTQTRGQFPYVLYYSSLDFSQHSGRVAIEDEARQCTLTVVATIIQKCTELLVLARENSGNSISYTPGLTPWEILGQACAFNMLLPNVFAHVSSLVSADPKSAVRLLGLIQDMLPHVAALNLLAGSDVDTFTQSSYGTTDPSLFTTSQHCTWVESEHPYKPATVSQYKVSFPDSVKWISLEFDPASSLAQPEDSLQIFVPKIDSPTTAQYNANDDNYQSVTPLWPVLQKFTSTSQWPQTAVILPGNEVLFSLETASDYNDHNDKNVSYGFRCLVFGFDWPYFINSSSLIHLEAELSFLGGMCAASLMKKELPLPIVCDEDLERDVELCDIVAQSTVKEHPSLLGKGLDLASAPTALQALDGNLPFCSQSNERLFLRDFVQCTPGTSGGRLALWLQPDSRVDVSRCLVLYSRDDLNAGYSTVIRIIIHDQYSDVVNVPGLQISAKAIHIDKLDFECDSSRKIRRVSQIQSTKSQQKVLNQQQNDTINAMDDSGNEESAKNHNDPVNNQAPPSGRTSERMRVRNNGDGTYNATWTPATAGCYSIIVDIDGYQMEEAFKVEVKEPPQGLTPPTQQNIKRPQQQPNKLRKFVAKNSAGLRVRAHPSLQSEQIGIVHVNGTIAFIEEIHNDDGVWLRLSAETIKQYCLSPVMEAWCLQYNQHLGKTLLLPVEEPKSILEQLIKDTVQKRTPDVARENKVKQSPLPPGSYTVIKCGASGHNVRSRPSLNATPIGMLVLGNRVNVKQCVVNNEGVWLLLDGHTVDKYCFNIDEEAWTLAMNRNDVMYLKGDCDNQPEASKGMTPSTGETTSSPSKRGFNFSIASTSKVGSSDSACYAFNTRIERTTSAEMKSTNPFVFGEAGTTSAPVESPKPISDLNRSESPKVPRMDKPKVIQKFLKVEESRSSSTHSSELKEIPAELSGVSVKELVKAIGESRANGNGVTPPDTPRRCASPRGGISPRISSRSSSPVPIPVSGAGGGVDSGVTSHRRSSTQSDTSALVSSLTRDLSQSPSQASASTRDPSPTPSGSSSLHSPQDSSPNTPNKHQNTSECSPRKMTQTGTQTSPEDSTSGTTAIRSHFSIGTSSTKESPKLSPKLCRKNRTAKRAISPSSRIQPSMQKNVNLPPKEPVKQAIRPSVAESHRAIFAAFLWHEGIVHDAMACASFLKFHPSLPKKGALVVTRHQHPASTQHLLTHQRHSVEVTNAGNYLHIQPSTLETLTRSAANANANRNRLKKTASPSQDATIIKEEVAESFHTVAVLPPALKALVYLWEELVSNTMQSAMLEELLACPFKIECKDEKAVNISRNNAKDKHLSSMDRETKKLNKKKTFYEFLRAKFSQRDETLIVEEGGGSAIIESSGASNEKRETVCELCGSSFAHPVTYHMRLQHPGCGAHAGGKGYNSGGNFCVGWAGACGDGGVGGSTWYLICDACRNLYMKTRKISNKSDKSGNKVKGGSVKKKAVETGSAPGSPAMTNLSSGLSSPEDPPIADAHRIMMNNAMFLLELGSAAGTGISPNPRRSSVGNMPSVAENYSPPENTGPFTPLPPFQCLPALGLQPPYDEHIFSDSQLRTPERNYNAPGPSLTGQRPLSEISLSDNEGDFSKNLRFHRSVSMGTNGAPWARNGQQDGRIIMMRKRNNSSIELSNEGGSSLLCHPSTTLQRLVPMVDSTAIVPNVVETDVDNPSEPLMLLRRPVLNFILQRHDLQALQFALKQSIRKAACRVFAMQAFNWLLRSVTQPICLHDLLWWFVTALTPVDLDSENEDDNKENKDNRKTDDYESLNVCEHPLSDIAVAGDAAWPLPSAFHALLQTISDIMLALPLGSPLQQAAVRCWGLRFTHSDHSFLHRSHVFSNISKILSRSEEMEDSIISIYESHHSVVSQPITSVVECLKDLTSYVEVKASSRPAMTNCLTDSSTETFWESGDEDRNKTKWLNIICAPHHQPNIISVYLDNCRDPANKVTNIVFYSGSSIDDLVKIKTIEVETRLVGCWISCFINEDHNVMRLELKGPDNTLRIRQLRVLGVAPPSTLNRTTKSSRGQINSPIHPAVLQQRACEAETLRVFRLITSQVFGKLILGEGSPSAASRLADSGTSLTTSDTDPPEESNELREHMVGILFSRSKLTHLQKQVIVHIVQAIRKESYRIRDEWEATFESIPSPGSDTSPNKTVPGTNTSSIDSPKATDTYCFEMLSMVLALSGSSVGRAYLSHQYGLIRDLLSLLHTGSARVQRQVTALIRRILPEISPTTFAHVLDIEHLPPTDFNIITTSKSSDSSEVFDVHRAGILDVFLGCIAKALTVQVKMKGGNDCGNGGNKGLSTVTLGSCIKPTYIPESRWYLRGSTHRKLAEMIVQLIKDMASGKLSETWANVTKGAIAENILLLTRLNDSQRVPSDCLQTPTLWLALASLCALDPEHGKRLSSVQWGHGQADGQPVPPRPTCSNHDDGVTYAIIQCNACGNLCADCDRFLHLHRRTRMHQRQVCKEEEEAIKVELHEGCGRTKLFWLLALADANTLKALVEFRTGGTRINIAGSGTGVCRFCGTTSNTGLLAIGNVCADHECQEYAKTACCKVHQCGHLCGGVKNENTCLPCLYGCTPAIELRQDADDMCMICFTEALSCAPAIQLKCGHVFHLHCCRTVLMKRWAGPRITFAFSQCPICKASIEHEAVQDELKSIQELYNDVRRKALMRLEYEGGRTSEIPSTYNNDQANYAMERYAYYVCYKCKKAYYGGEARCDAEMGTEYDPTELVCGGCSDVARAQMCPRHGTDFLEYKCRYCCSVAVFFCFGSTHFCNACHEDFQKITGVSKLELPACPAGPKMKKLDGDECPLHVKHPPTGEEYALGCGVCRNAHTF